MGRRVKKKKTTVRDSLSPTQQLDLSSRYYRERKRGRKSRIRRSGEGGG